MPKILAIETATEACSAALINAKDAVALDDNQNIVSRFEIAPREHTKLILPMIEAVLEEGECELSDIDAIAFGRGPGAFTGLRIAAGIAQGLALSIDKPVVPVSTLAALALSAIHKSQKPYEGDSIIAALDARIDEVYWGVFAYKNKELTAITEEKVSKMTEIGKYMDKSENKNFIGLGSAFDAYPIGDYLQRTNKTINIIKQSLPSAAEIARLALVEFLGQRTVAIEQAQPVYIRNNVAEKSKKK